MNNYECKVCNAFHSDPIKALKCNHMGQASTNYSEPKMKQKDKWSREHVDRFVKSQESMGCKVSKVEYAMMNTGWHAGFEFAKSNILRNLSLSCEANQIIKKVIERTGEDEVEK